MQPAPPQRECLLTFCEASVLQSNWMSSGDWPFVATTKGCTLEKSHRFAPPAKSFISHQGKPLLGGKLTFRLEKRARSAVRLLPVWRCKTAFCLVLSKEEITLSWRRLFLSQIPIRPLGAHSSSAYSLWLASCLTHSSEDSTIRRREHSCHTFQKTCFLGKPPWSHWR